MIHESALKTDQKQFGPGAFVFQTGVGGQCGGQGYALRFFHQLRRQRVERVGYADLQILFCGEGLARGKDFSSVKVVNDGVGAGAAGIDPDPNHEQSVLCMNMIYYIAHPELNATCIFRTRKIFPGERAQYGRSPVRMPDTPM